MSQRQSEARLAPSQAAPAPVSRPGAKPGAAPGLLLRAYRALTTAAAPAATPFLALRARRGKEAGERSDERLGIAGCQRPDGPLLWFHAASVGETNAVLPLIGAIGTRRPDLNLLLTTVTVTSARLAETRLEGRAIHQFLPLDAPAFVRRFLDHWRPDLAVFVEAEIWPNFVFEMSARGVPLVLVNGRLSERSYRRWRRWPTLSRPLFGRFELILSQNEDTAARLGELGAARVRAVGNLKIDVPPPPVNDDALERLRTLTQGRPIFLAASTHAGEEGLVIEAHLRMRERHRNLLTVVAPRHPTRGQALSELARTRGLTAERRSQGGEPAPGCDVYVADTIGELGLFYALAPVAFIGGSLVGRGGQNPAEAVRLGAAVLSGPHHQNFADAYGALLQDKACVVVGSGAVLAAQASALMDDEAARQGMLERGRAALDRIGGALDRTLEALEDYLPPAQGIRRAS